MALVGDAIHPMTPDLAQGACQAIVDATTLAGRLAEAGGPQAALREIPAATVAQRRPDNLASAQLRQHGPNGTGASSAPPAMRCSQPMPLSLQLRQLDLDE